MSSASSLVAAALRCSVTQFTEHISINQSSDGASLLSRSLKHHHISWPNRTDVMWSRACWTCYRGVVWWNKQRRPHIMIMELGRKSLSLLLLDQLTEPGGKKKYREEWVYITGSVINTAVLRCFKQKSDYTEVSLRCWVGSAGPKVCFSEQRLDLCTSVWGGAEVWSCHNTSCCLVSVACFPVFPLTSPVCSHARSDIVLRHIFMSCNAQFWSIRLY